jgi:FkbM family methyltransferase
MSSQNNIDHIIINNIKDPGFFIEAGGSDPRDFSNTELLEANGWRGLIVEPKTEFNQIYESLRPNSIVENLVLVSNEYEKETIMGDFSHYHMGGVENIHGLNWNPTEHKCSTLDKVLKKHNINEVQFFSLDVEGYEINVLNGLNFDDVFFHVLCIENHGKWAENGDLIYDNFDFLNKFGFYKKYTVSQHEFYINEKSQYYNTFLI